MSYTMTYQPDFLGSISLKRWASTGNTADNNASSGSETSLSSTYQYNIGAARVVPFNIMSNAYPATVSASGYPVQKIRGKRRPGFTIVANAKSSWFTMNFLNQLILALDSNNQTARYSLQMVTGLSTVRVFDWARCSNVRITGSAGGGAVVVEMGFNCRWGESEMATYSSSEFGTNLFDVASTGGAGTAGGGDTWPSATTFVAPSAGYDAGEALGATDWHLSTTAQYVRGFSLNLVRGQGYSDFSDGTGYAREIATGIFSGTLSLDVSPNSPTIPTNTCQIYFNTGASRFGSYTGFKATLLLNMDSYELPQDVGIANMTAHYALADISAGGNPCALSSITAW